MRGPVTPYTLAARFVGMEEVEGTVSNPAILAMLRLDARWPTGDDVPWCSAFVNAVAWLLDMPRSKSLAARSWLRIGTPVSLEDARPGFDVVVLKRGGGHQPGPEVIEGATGHVGFFAGQTFTSLQAPGAHRIKVLGGNQGDSVSVAEFPANQVLGIRRLA